MHRRLAASRWISYLLMLLVSSGEIRAAEITIFAATSLTESLKEVAILYQKTSADRIVFNFAASNVLAQQLQAGAPADLFISADEAKMDSLQAAGLIAAGTRISLLGNSLVIITPLGDSPVRSLADLTAPTIQHLALADPKAVPAGIYAKACLEKAKLWQALQPKILPTENVRAALALVESGNAEAGIVYKTDAAISKKVSVTFEIPVSDCPAIRYPAAVLKDSPNASAARALLHFLTDKSATEIFRKYGFIVPAP
jgi:molybdate transport system substrate-binding protein